ncbi:MAG: peptidoglycan DD-metalloendopeptidase family protein, partial [Pseudomonadota bacterium]
APARRAATPAQAAASLGPRRLRRPVDGRIIRPFGEGVGARKNAGVDIAAPVGAPVVAAAEGRIAFVSDPTSPVGAVVLMTHPGGMTTIYGRLTDILVSPGQSIAAGAPLARVAPRAGGRSALHFELRHGSDPVNPTPFL